MLRIALMYLYRNGKSNREDKRKRRRRRRYSFDVIALLKYKQNLVKFLVGGN